MIDIHVHFFPPSVFQAIWRFFQKEGSGLWDVKYKVYEEALVEELDKSGVKNFTSLVYAHKPGMASFLNDYIRDWARKERRLIPFGTVFAGDDNSHQTANRIFDDYGFIGIKLHPFVSGENLDDERFFPVYEKMAKKGKILLCHPGSGPAYDATDGAQRLERVLRNFPELNVIVAHCGAFEYGDYRALAQKFANIYFDTAMNCVGHDHSLETSPFINNCPGPEFFQTYGDRILFGSDFPNIPYDYKEQIRAVRSMNPDPAKQEKIFHKTAEALLRKAGWEG